MNINNTLMTYQSYQLQDIDKANLQDRVDSKFVIPINLLLELLVTMRSHYKVLDLAGRRVSHYINEYFDTHSMKFYYDHHNGKLNRYKVRKRTYLETGLTFLEVKYKNNKGRTIKKRTVSCNKWSENDTLFIEKNLLNMDVLLSSTQKGGYKRIALANENIAERLTLDFDMWYQKLSNEAIELSGFFIAELKQAKHSKLSPFYQFVTKHNLNPISYSKYCIGCALTDGSLLKKNRFKPTLLKVDNFCASSLDYKLDSTPYFSHNALRGIPEHSEKNLNNFTFRIREVS